jgi:hypothetical protein
MKNIFPLHMAKAHTAAIPDRPPQKRHCTKCCAAAPFLFHAQIPQENTLHFLEGKRHTVYGTFYGSFV